MLYLGNGIREVKVDETHAVQLFPDFSDPQQFYYLPNFPRIAKMEDGTPAIRLLVYRENLDDVPEGGEDAVAFLSLDVDCGWPPELIEQAASKIRIADNLEQNPRLSPIFFREGSVRLLLLDAATPPEGDDSAQPTRFVTKIMGAGSPALYGDNRAIFQASLTKKGAAALSAALDGVTPIGVVYSLTFAGLQPAFNVKATVEWEKVYEHFSEHENFNFLFYEEDIQKQIDELVESKAIEVEVTVEGVGSEAMDAEREQVMTQVRQMIFDNFFQATFERETGAGTGVEDDIANTLRTIGQDAITLGMGYTYERQEVTIEELRTLNLDWTARRAAERTIYPQAHMHNLLSDGGVTEQQLVTVVDGADGLWRTLPIQVIAAAAWDADGIAGITIDLEYADADSGDVRHWSTFLDKNMTSALHRDWMDRTSGNALRYKYEVVFLDEGVPGPSPKVGSATEGAEWIEHEGTVVVIHPRELYESMQLEVGSVPGFAFERWPAVQAVVRYRTEDGSFEHYEDGVLRADNPKFTTRFRTDRGVPGTRDVRLVYIGATGERVETEWMPMVQDQWVVEDPHPNELTVRAVVAGKRENIANLIVDLEYTDPGNGIHETGTLQFLPENINLPQAWTVHLADPTKRRYRYRMTLITVDEGDFIQTGWIGTDAPTLPVGEVYVRTLTVEVVTAELAAGVEAVEVELVYDDPDNDLHREDKLTLSANSRQEWKVLLKDAAKRAYQATITWVHSDGFNPKVGPVTRTGTLMVIAGDRPEDG